MKSWKKTHRARKKNRLIKFQLNFTNEEYERFHNWRVKHSWSKDRAFKEVLLYIKKECEKQI